MPKRKYETVPTKKCEFCDTLIYFDTVSHYCRGVREKKTCKDCKKLKRKIYPKPILVEKKCPICNDIISYTDLVGFRKSVENNNPCKPCLSIKTGFTGKFATVGKNTGEQHPNFGISNYSRWLEEFGKEVADKKQEEYCKKQSINSSGPCNPMYGKPRPENSNGYGWSGNYKKIHFRSLSELLFMINMDNDEIQWKSAEYIVIPYIDENGTSRTYRPDFIIGNELIEIKPKKFQQLPLVKLKAIAGQKYCENNNLTYKFLEVKVDLRRKKDYLKIKKAYDDGDLFFYEKFQLRFAKRIEKERK